MKLSMVAVILAIACCLPATAQENQRKQACNVAIINPRLGDPVQEDGQVEGTATVPAGTHLWIFVHRRGLGLWWPQGGGPAQIKEDKWDVLVTYGLPRDSGSDFEITTAVVDDVENSRLLGWVKKTEDTGQYPGIKLPASVQGCPVPHVLVKKG